MCIILEEIFKKDSHNLGIIFGAFVPNEKFPNARQSDVIFVFYSIDFKPLLEFGLGNSHFI
jgi:hypothetical protein